MKKILITEKAKEEIRQGKIEEAINDLFFLLEMNDLEKERQELVKLNSKYKNLINPLNKEITRQDFEFIEENKVVNDILNLTERLHKMEQKDAGMETTLITAKVKEKLLQGKVTEAIDDLSFLLEINGLKGYKKELGVLANKYTDLKSSMDKDMLPKTFGLMEETEIINNILNLTSKIARIEQQGGLNYSNLASLELVLDEKVKEIKEEEQKKLIDVIKSFLGINVTVKLKKNEQWLATS